MSQIVEIDPAFIDAEQNNREDFSHVPGLAESIAERGQDAPIIVVSKPDGRYLLIAGESRTRACMLLGIKVKAIVRDDLSSSSGYMLTLVENEARKQTNDLEKAIGFNRAIVEYGYTVEQVAKHIGKKGQLGIKYVQDRLSLLKLREDLQKMVQDGQLTIGYAVLMVPLDSNRQLIAVRHLRDNPSPTVKWFAAVCGDLLAQQSQQSLFFGLFGGDPAAPGGSSVAVKSPPDPVKYAPNFSGRAAVVADMEKWQQAGEDWRNYGKQDKALACSAIVTTLAAVLPMLPESIASAAVASPRPSQVVYKQQAQDKVLSLLVERGELTTGSLQQLANVPAGKLAGILEDYEKRGIVASRIAGKGKRWTAVCQSAA